MNDALVMVLAKGTSTRIPGKNLVRVGGRPLLHYTFDHLRAMREPADRVVLTESDPVAAECQEFRVCWEALDKSPLVCRRAELAVRELERDRGRPYRWVSLLNADVPVRPLTLIDDTFREIEATGADIVQSVVEVPILFHPYRSYFLRRTGDLLPILPNADYQEFSQHFPQCLAVVGGALTMARDVLPKAGYMGTGFPFHNRPIVCPVDQLVEIDSPADLETFRRQIEHGDDARLSRPVVR